MPSNFSLTDLLPLSGLPLAWQIYTLLTYGAVLILIALNVLFILPPLVRESWDWLHEALCRSDVDQATRDRARMNLVVRISDYRKGVRL